MKLSQEMKFVFLFAATYAISGCASTNFSPKIDITGKYVNTLKIENTADALSDSEVQDIDVLMGELPEGIDLKDGKLTILDSSPYEVLAKVGTRPKPELAAILGIWPYDFVEDESWRKGMCYWQIPLSWLTLTIWSWYMPTFIPCRPLMSSSPEGISARKDRLITTMKKAVKVLGGDLLWITHIGKTVFIQVGTNVVLGAQEMTNAEGYALKRRNNK